MLTPDTRVRLRPNAIAEPLFNSWYVTLPMIAPHTSAMLVKNQHVKILKSYILSPDMHVAAAADPAMRGGPFADIAKERLDDVKALLASTLDQQRDLITFAEDVAALDALLLEQAKGYSLESLYPQVPAALKGYVELVYDLNNVPSMRFIEGLLYRSPYYDTARQSVLLSLSHSDTRPFVLSSPRLPEAGKINVALPFASPVYDELFAMRDRARPFGEICALLGMDPANETLQGLFMPDTAVPPAPAAPAISGENVQVRYFGHACLLFESAGCNMLFDPLISYQQQSEEARFTYDDLPAVIDYIVITHGHLDHMVLETLLQLRHKTRHIVVPKTGKGALQEPSLKLMLKHLGFASVIEVDELDDVTVPGGTLTSIPFLGEHHDLNISGKSAWRVQLGARSFLIAADSANLEPALYDHIARLYGPVDTIFLGMECDGAPLTWFYGHLLTRPMARAMAYSRQGSGSDQVRASGLVASLGCKQVFIYAMGLENWFGHILSLNVTDESKQIVESNRFIELSRAEGMQAERLYAQKTLTFAQK